MNRLILAFAAAALLGHVAPVEAGHGCSQCGCNSCCKVCRLEPTVTKVTTYKYCLQCEDMCLHGPSKCIGTKSVCDCNGCRHCEKIMQPTCCKVKTIAKLVKIPVVEEKCGWKCVVVNRCNGCTNCTSVAREATEIETKLAVLEAERLGVLQAAAEAPIEVTIAAEEPAAAAPVFDAPPVADEGKASLRIFGSLLGK